MAPYKKYKKKILNNELTRLDIVKKKKIFSYIDFHFYKTISQKHTHAYIHTHARAQTQKEQKHTKRTKQNKTKKKNKKKH